MPRSSLIDNFYNLDLRVDYDCKGHNNLKVLRADNLLLVFFFEGNIN